MAAAPSFSRQQSYRWKGLHDPAGRIIGGFVQGPAIHHRPRVVLSMVIGRERNRALSAPCSTPCSCMKRTTFMANICAGDISP